MRCFLVSFRIQLYINCMNLSSVCLVNILPYVVYFAHLSVLVLTMISHTLLSYFFNVSRLYFPLSSGKNKRISGGSSVVLLKLTVIFVGARLELARQ